MTQADRQRDHAGTSSAWSRLAQLAMSGTRDARVGSPNSGLVGLGVVVHLLVPAVDRADLSKGAVMILPILSPVGWCSSIRRGSRVA